MMVQLVSRLLAAVLGPSEACLQVLTPYGFPYPWGVYSDSCVREMPTVMGEWVVDTLFWSLVLVPGALLVSQVLGQGSGHGSGSSVLDPSL